MKGGRSRLTAKDLEELIPMASVGLKGKNSLNTSKHNSQGISEMLKQERRDNRIVGDQSPERREYLEERKQLASLPENFKSTLNSIYTRRPAAAMGATLSSSVDLSRPLGKHGRAMSGLSQRKASSQRPLSATSQRSSSSRPTSATQRRKLDDPPPTYHHQGDGGGEEEFRGYLEMLNFNAEQGTVKKLNRYERIPSTGTTPRNSSHKRMSGPAAAAATPQRQQDNQEESRAAAEMGPSKQAVMSSVDAAEGKKSGSTTNTTTTNSRSQIPAPPKRPMSAPSNRIPVGTGVVNFPHKAVAAQQKQNSMGPTTSSMAGSPAKGLKSLKQQQQSTTHAKARPQSAAPGGRKPSKDQHQGAEEEGEVVVHPPPAGLLQTTTGSAPVIKAVEFSYSGGGHSPRRFTESNPSEGAGVSSSSSVNINAGGDQRDGGNQYAATLPDNGFFGHYEYASIRDYLQARLKTRFGSYGQSVAENLASLKEELESRGGEGSSGNSGSDKPGGVPIMPSPREYLHQMQFPSAGKKKVERKVPAVELRSEEYGRTKGALRRPRSAVTRR